jgi:hypothetical protein
MNKDKITKLLESCKSLQETISTNRPDTMGAHSKIKGKDPKYMIPSLASALSYVVKELMNNPHAVIPTAYKERMENLIQELDAYFRMTDKELDKVGMHNYKSDAWVDQ